MNPDLSPTVTEIAELASWLWRITCADRDADPDEREAFLAAKRQLLARIEELTR